MTVTKQAAPRGLLAVVQDLQVACEGPDRVGRFDTFLVDFSTQHLSLTAVTPCIWIPAPQNEESSDEERVAALHEAVQLGSWQNSTILVFVDGETAVLRERFSAALPRFLFFNAEEQAAMAAAESPGVAMVSLLQQKLTRLELAPYETSKPVTSSRFFGRESEIERVLNNPTTSYLFVGIRRIGKTSLLKELKRRLDAADPPKKDQIRRIYVDCTVLNSEEALLRTLIFHLEQSGHTLLAGRLRNPHQYQEQLLNHYVAVHGQPLTFLLDEFDRLVPHMRADWQLLDVLRTAVAAGKVRFILAGFRLAMEATTSIHSPFVNLITPIRLEPLPLEVVREMVLQPLVQLGVTVIEPEEVVRRIHAETAGLPNYIQFYCKILLQQLAQSDRDQLHLDDLEAAPADETFRNFVINTFMSNTELLERAIVYMLVAEGEGKRPFRFTQADIAAGLSTRQLSLPKERIDTACRNLQMAGVFRRQVADFTFAVPLFPRMLWQMRNVTFLFDRMREALQMEKILS